MSLENRKIKCTIFYKKDTTIMLELFTKFFTLYGDAINTIVTIGIFIVGYFLQRRARRIQKLLTWNQYREPIKLYADEVVDVLSETEALCEVDPEKNPVYFWERYNKILANFSSLRDKGKFIIPNYVPSASVEDRNAAYKGIRHEAIECVCVAYKVTVAINYTVQLYNTKCTQILQLDEYTENEAFQLKKLKKAIEKLPQGYMPNGFKGKGWSCKAAIVEAKRQFVSTCQQLLEPQVWSEQIKEVINKK